MVQLKVTTCGKGLEMLFLGGVNNQLVNIQNNLLATFRGNIDVGEADRRLWTTFLLIT